MLATFTIQAGPSGQHGLQLPELHCFSSYQGPWFVQADHSSTTSNVAAVPFKAGYEVPWDVTGDSRSWVAPQYTPLQVVTPAAVNGAIAPVDGSLVNMSMKDWAMNLPFLLINSIMAGLLGAVFNSLRMWLWKVGSTALGWDCAWDMIWRTSGSSDG
jgi:hypothetical protein